MLLEKDLPMKEQIRSFVEVMDPEHEQHHERRREFEHSLNMINETITQILEEEEGRAQKLLPHYFEKYKTDGIEYNIYIGQSILEKGTFDPVFIRNFRLWQLLTMVNIARETHRLIPKMKMPLETTQLILCYSNPLSIVFRLDETRFDVAGAHNIRFEIVKKRIDKANINGTTDRITQPNTIAVIYTLDKEAREYERYFDFLRSKNFIAGETEYLEVEPLQGVQGLKAMRITVNYGEDESRLSWNEEELLKHSLEEVT
jgi:hypothetical protein